MTRVIAAAALALLTAAPIAADAATHAKPHAGLIDVRTCPITGGKVSGAGAGSEVVGRYRVHFCCEGCQPLFDKMTSAQKMTKVKTALHKS